MTTHNVSETDLALILDDVWEGYAECAQWADAPRDEDGEEIEYTDEDLSELVPGVEDFVRDNLDDLIQYAAVRDSGDYNAWEGIGHDLWLSAQGHGTGFWDRGAGKLGDRLHAASKHYGADLYVDDKGVLRAQ